MIRIKDTQVKYIIHLIKTNAALNEDALSYYTVRGLYFLAVIFARSILSITVLRSDLH